MLMSEYLNEEFCDFNNDASATSFGWNFQVNAGICFCIIYKMLQTLKLNQNFKI